MDDLTCDACGLTVPAGAYCGNCGADLTNPDGDGRGRLRIREYAAAPREHLFTFAAMSTFLPQLLPRSRTPFRVAFFALVAVMFGLAAARWQAPLIAVCAVGMPLLFICYLRQTRATSELPPRALVFTALFGLVLGIAWGAISGGIMAGDFDVSLRSGMGTGSTLIHGLAIPVGSSLLMVLPSVIVRLVRHDRQSLHGFIFGSLGAIVFTSATTLALLVPQLADGPVADHRQTSALVIEAALRGLVIPLTAVAAGGMVGTALGFSRPVVVIPVVLFVVATSAAMGFLELARVSDDTQLLLHLAFPTLMWLGLRVILQAALLYEDRTPIRRDHPMLCEYCKRVVPDMPFCPSCGIAMRVAAATVDETAPGTEQRLSYALPARAYLAAPTQVSQPRKLFTVMVIGLVTAGSLAFAISWKITPAGAAKYRCPPDCGRPPIGKPVVSNPRFTAANGEFSVSYPAASTAYKIDTDPNGVVLNYLNGDTGTMELFGQAAMGRAAKRIAEQLVNRNYPDATIAYEIPNASVGYQPGYGVAMDVYPQNTDGRYVRLRVLVLVAVKNNYALVASAVGPYRQFGPDFGNGHPSGANLELALDMGQYVNSFRWRGDPLR